MAEFSEVVRNVRRLCIGKGCDSCQLSQSNNGRGILCIDFRDEYPEEYEAIVMKWAKENPVMTNADKFKEVFGVSAERFPCPMRTSEECEHHNVCGSCKYDFFWEKEYQPPKENE